uniref:Bm12306 n=1 Tax=Brugia malayi TaxID=6279 RepID=A0A1I9GB73_BRUMA|nr:Bm12306 [Brugia malayi]
MIRGTVIRGTMIRGTVIRGRVGRKRRGLRARTGGGPKGAWPAGVKMGGAERTHRFCGGVAMQSRRGREEVGVAREYKNGRGLQVEGRGELASSVEAWPHGHGRGGAKRAWPTGVRRRAGRNGRGLQIQGRGGASTPVLWGRGLQTQGARESGVCGWTWQWGVGVA